MPLGASTQVNPAGTSKLLRRLQGSTVVWSWIFNFFRLASGLILLPLVLNKFSTDELGMYYVLLSLAALVPIIDFGFGPTIGRFVSYAMGGAVSIQVEGLSKPEGVSNPNYDLLWQLLHTARVLYRFLILILLVVLGLWGTYLVEMRIHEMPSPLITRLAWLATLLSALFDIYSGWWLVYLRGLNQVLPATRIGVFGLAIRMVVAATLLLMGGGLLSVPIGTFCGSLVQRHVARRNCLKMLPGSPPAEKAKVKECLNVLWPNAWRTGLLFVGGYLTTNANTAICLHALGLAVNAKYGLSVQLLTVVTGLASVWTLVKWPLVGQHFARHEFEAVQSVLRPRFWLQSLTFLATAGGLLLFGPPLLSKFGGGKQLLAVDWFALMTLGSFLDMQLNFWAMIIFVSNRLTFLWPMVGSNVVGLLLSLTLLHYTNFGVGALVLGPLIAGSVFNYWFWPFYSSRSLGSHLLHFLFGGYLAKAAAGPTS
jgi:O-antigen/teichoic acid export membrane protein